MDVRGLALIHGGEHAGDCWTPTVGELRRQAPELPIVVVDLPGRRGKAGDLATLTISDCVASAVADIEESGLHELIVVGHSMAGLIVPGVVAKLGAGRVREMILVSAFIPPQGATLGDTLGGKLAPFARMCARRGGQFKLPDIVNRFVLCNGMTREERKFTMSRLCPESMNLISEPVDRSDMPREVPRTWILTLRDRALSVRQQHRCIAALGGVDTLIAVDSCHDVMIRDHQWLAATLVNRCRTMHFGDEISRRIHDA